MSEINDVHRPITRREFSQDRNKSTGFNIARNRPLAGPNDAAARKRCFDQGVAVVDGQPRNRLNLSLYTIQVGERPVRGRRVVMKRVLDASVFKQVVRSLRHALPFEVVGRSACHEAERSKRPRNKPGVRKLPDPDAHIEIFGHEVDNPVIQHQFDRDVRVDRQEFWQLGRQHGGDDLYRGCDPQCSSGVLSGLGDDRVGSIHLGRIYLTGKFRPISMPDSRAESPWSPKRPYVQRPS